MANPPAPRGKSVAEIRNKYAQPRIRANLAAAKDGQQPDETYGVVDKVNATLDELRERRLADSISSQAEAEFDLQKAELEAKKLEVEVKTVENRSRLQELRASTGEGASSKDAMMQAMLEAILQNQGGGGSEVSGALEGFGRGMAEILSEIRAEIKAINGKRDPDVSPVEKVTSDMEMLIRLKEVFAALGPPAQAVPVLSAAERDLDTTIKMQQMQLDHEYRLAQMQQQKDRWNADIELKRREIEVEERRAQYLGDGLRSVAESVKPIMAELIEAATKPKAAPPIPTYAPYIPPMPVAPVPQPVAATAMAFNVNPEASNGYHNPELDEGTKCHYCNGDIDIGTDHSVSEIECPHCRNVNRIEWDD